VIFNEQNLGVAFVGEPMLVNRDSGRLMSDKLVLIYLEMRYFNKTEGELATRMDKWLYLLRNLGQLPVK
jgi:hypothetical protein